MPVLLAAPAALLIWWAQDRGCARRLARVMTARLNSLAADLDPGRRRRRRWWAAVPLLLALLALGEELLAQAQLKLTKLNTSSALRVIEDSPELCWVI